MGIKDQIEQLRKFADALEWGHKHGLIEGAKIVLPSERNGKASTPLPSVPRTNSIIKEIFDAVAKLPDTFTTRDVLNATKGRAKRPSVNDAMRRLIRGNVVEVVEQGSGRKAATYKKVK